MIERTGMIERWLFSNGKFERYHSCQLLRTGSALIHYYYLILDMKDMHRCDKKASMGQNHSMEMSEKDSFDVIPTTDIFVCPSNSEISQVRCGGAGFASVFRFMHSLSSSHIYHRVLPAGEGLAHLLSPKLRWSLSHCRVREKLHLLLPLTPRLESPSLYRKSR